MTELSLRLSGLVYILIGVVNLLKGEFAMKRLKERVIWIGWRLLMACIPVITTMSDPELFSKWNGT